MVNTMADTEGNGKVKQALPKGFLDDAQGVFAELWNAWHCSESRWTLVPMADMTSRRDLYFPTINSRPEDSKVRRGMPGFGYMSELNGRFQDMLVESLSEDHRLALTADKFLAEMATLKARLLRWTLWMVPQRSVVEFIMDRLREARLKQCKKMDDRRGTTATAPRQYRPHLQSLLTAFLLMLNASRPVSAALCKARGLDTAASVVVMLHGALDITLMVATLVLASEAHPADQDGAAIQSLVDIMQQLFIEFAEALNPKHLSSPDTVQETLFTVVGNFLTQNGEGYLQQLKHGVKPAAAIEPYYLCRIAVGALLFMLASSTLAASLATGKPRLFEKIGGF